MTLVGNVHIAAGNSTDIESALSFLKKNDIETSGNPDLSVRTYKSFGIDDARELSSMAAARAFGERRVFLIVADSLTSEAQNALLKTLEEAPGNSLFVFLVPNPDVLLATMKSRAQMLHLAHARAPRSHIEAELFLKATPAKRLKLLKPLLEKGDDDKRDLGAVIAFLTVLEDALAKKPESLQALYRARKYVTDRGALVKPLLEQVALLV